MPEIELDNITQRYFLVKNAIERTIKESEIKNDIKLILVTKYVDEKTIKHFINLGHKDFGENRVQDAYRKWQSIKKSNDDVKLHYLGKVQSNKINKILDLFDIVQTVDSFNVLKTLREKSLALKKRQDFYIQINIGNEVQKSGIITNKLEELMLQARSYTIDIDGFMCIPPFSEDSVHYFKSMKELAIKYKVKNLSMGMSTDFITAIKCGATEVRVGKAIFMPE